jgi:hypothetical protein
MITVARLALTLALGTCALGCASKATSARNKSPLAPFKPSLETSTLEVTFVRHEYELPALNEELWQEVDETAISPEVRGGLLKNGLRAGVIAGKLPLQLESLLSGTSPPAPSSADGPAATPTNGQLTSAPTVSRRTLHVLPQQRSELLASDVYERLNLLVREESEGSGHTYFNARCALAVTATPLGDGRVRISLAPEVQHGEPRQQYRGDDGMWRVDSVRPKAALDKMAFDVVLAPGQAIVLGARADRPASVGHYFFTESANGELEQKLLLIRFTGNKYDQLLLTDRGGESTHARLTR